MKARITIACWIATHGVLSPARAAQIDWFTIDGGGRMFASGGEFGLSGTTGQPDAGFMTGGSFTLAGGFWTEASTGVPVTGDCDGDGDVTLNDYGGFADCLSGPDVPYAPADCACADFDGNGAIDLLDFAAYQVSLTN